METVNTHYELADSAYPIMLATKSPAIARRQMLLSLAIVYSLKHTF